VTLTFNQLIPNFAKLEGTDQTINSNTASRAIQHQEQYSIKSNKSSECYAKKNMLKLSKMTVHFT